MSICSPILTVVSSSNSGSFGASLPPSWSICLHPLLYQARSPQTDRGRSPKKSTFCHLAHWMKIIRGLPVALRVRVQIPQRLRGLALACLSRSVWSFVYCLSSPHHLFCSPLAQVARLRSSVNIYRHESYVEDVSACAVALGTPVFLDSVTLQSPLSGYRAPGFAPLASKLISPTSQSSAR